MPTTLRIGSEATRWIFGSRCLAFLLLGTVAFRLDSLPLVRPTFLRGIMFPLSSFDHNLIRKDDGIDLIVGVSSCSGFVTESSGWLAVLAFGGLAV